MFSAAAVATLPQPQCTEKKNFPCCTDNEWGGGDMETNIQFDRLVLLLLGRTPGIRSVQQSPNVSWGHAFVSMPHPCCWFPCNTFHHIPIYAILQSDEAALPVCPSVPETLNLWGQSRSQVRSSGTGLHSVSARQSGKRIFGGEFTLGEAPLVIAPFITTRRLSDATMSRWHLRYVPDVIGMHQVGPGDGRPSSCSADSLRGPILLAGFVLSPSPGPNRKTAKGRDPALYISFSEVTSSPRWCFCTSKLPLFLVCASIKIYVSQRPIFAHWSPGHEAEVMNIKQQKACGSYPSRRPLLGFFLFTTAFK